MRKFKSFSPRVDTKRRLVMIRVYSGVNGSNIFCYLIYRINKKNSIDKRFKYLYSFGTDDYGSVNEFKHSQTGEKTRVFKSSFKGVFGIENKTDVMSIWNSNQSDM